MDKTYKTYKRSRSIRLHSVNYQEILHPVHIIISTHNKKSIFTNSDYVTSLVDELLKIKHVVTYCIMPDHLHLLLNPDGDKIDVLNIVKTLKGRVSTRLYRQFKLKYLWQKSFYDHILRKEETLDTISLYILNNPVRKGLVKHWKEYLYSWSKYHQK